MGACIWHGRRSYARVWGGWLYHPLQLDLVCPLTVLPSCTSRCAQQAHLHRLLRRPGPTRRPAPSHPPPSERVTS